jgi:hypothetical protein
MATKKIVLKKNKSLDKIWHPESTLVFKSAKEKIVIGRCVDDCLVSLDEEALELCAQWKFKYDKELVEEGEEEQDEEEQEDEDEDEDEEKLNKVIDKEEEKLEDSNEEDQEDNTTVKKDLNVKKEHCSNTTVKKDLNVKKEDCSNISVKQDDLKSVECNTAVKKEVVLNTDEKCSSNYESLLKVCVSFIENIKTVVGELEKNNSTTLLNCQKDYDKIIDEKNNLLKTASDTLEVTTKELEDTKQKLSNIKKALGL